MRPATMVAIGAPAKLAAVERRVARFCSVISAGAKRPGVIGGEECEVGRLTLGDAPGAA